VGTGQTLFKEPSSEWDKLRTTFVHFLGWYHSIYQLEDAPSHVIIDDDAKLDLWLKQRHMEYKKQKAEADRASSGKNKRASGSTFGFDFASINDE